jgi:hypothetical protein
MDDTIAVVSIATREYTKYWKEMANSLFSSISAPTTIYVATDDADIAKGVIGLEDDKNKVVVVEIPSLGWPEATLFRYEIIRNMLKNCTEAYTFYLDADMIVNQDFVQLLNPKVNEIILVSHPGYYRPPGTLRLFLYLKKPKTLASDLFHKIHVGGLGAWEKRKDSLAFVVRKKRINYVCGAFWGGDTKRVVSLITQLEHNVKDDLDNGIIAKWHDESHLNAWAAKNDFRLANSAYCYDSTYQNIKHLESIITAVQKPQNKN